jgi:glycosyltransferase involved in cell wall biosynthesis
MLIGHLDHVGEDRITGWARDETDVARRLVLELFDGEQRIARFVADRMRSDLANAGMGDGRYGFWLQIPSSLFPMPVHRLSVRFAESGADIGGSPRVLYRSGPAIDGEFTRWVDDHVDAAIASADRVELLAPLLGFAVNLAARVVAARDRFDSLDRSTALGDIDIESLPEVLRRSAERASVELKPLHVPVQAEPWLSVIIACSGRLGDDVALVRSVVDACKGMAAEILLVDNSGAVETALLPFLVRGGARVIRLEHPAGVAAAYAEGAAAARGQTLLFLSGVKALGPGAVRLLLDTLDAEGRNNLVAPRLIDGDRVAAAGFTIDPLGSKAAIGHGAHVSRMAFRILRSAEDLPLNALMADRGRLERAGGFAAAARLADYAGSHLAFAMREAGGHTLVQAAADAVLAGPIIGLSARDRGRPMFLARWSSALRPLGGAGPEAEPRLALVIDERFPAPDEDAASVAVLSHATALRRLGYEVEFIATAPSREDAGRAGALRARGIAAHEDVDNPVQFLGSRKGQFDLVYLHRFHVADPLIDEVRATQPAARLVFSVADLHHVRDDRTRLLVGKPDEAAIAATREAEFRCISKADVTLTHSTWEQSYLREALPDAHIAVALWQVPAAKGEVDMDGREGLCFLGNFRHAPNADAVAHFAGSVWPVVGEGGRLGGLDIVGAHTNLVAADQLPEGCRVAGYVRDIRAYLRRKRLMVAPLRFGAGVKGKVLLSLAEGLPCIMSPVAAEGMPLPAALAEALVAPDDAAFARRIEALQTDHELWLSVARQSVEWAREALGEDAVLNAIRLALAPLEPLSPAAVNAAG